MDTQKAAELEARISQTPEDYQSYLDLADLYIQAGNHRDAYRYIKELAEKLPNSVDVLTTAGTLAVRLEEHEEALEHLIAAARLSPDDRNIWHNIGLLNATLDRLDDAEAAFRKVIELDPRNPEGFNDLGVILAHKNDPDSAIRFFNKALTLDPGFQKACENLCEVCFQSGDFETGLRVTDVFLDNTPDCAEVKQWRSKFETRAQTPNVKSQENITTDNNLGTEPRDLKIAFFASQDSFAGDIIRHLSTHNEVRRFNGKTVDDMAHLMRWADVAWFEWCDQLLIEATKLDKTCRIVCRLHSYEAFTEMPAHVNWSKVDRLILVNESVSKILNQFHDIKTDRVVISNGVDLDRFRIPDNKRYGKKICSLGYINYKKNPGLLLYTFKAIHDWDPEFEFYIAGQHQDPRIKIYFDHMLERLNIPVHLENWTDDVPGYFKDKDFVISTSLFESFHYSVAEGMASGLLPLVHAWPGAENVYPGEYMFNTPDDCVRLVEKLLTEDRAQLGRQARDYIADRYSLDKQKSAFDGVFTSLNISPKSQRSESVKSQLVPDIVEKKKLDYGKVSIVIPTFNRAEYLDEAIKSALNQTYADCEVIVCDDASTDSTPYVLDKYRDKIKVLKHHRNRGVSAALNSCIREASGEFVSWLSSDDAYKPEKVERQVEYLHKHPDIAMVYSDFEYIDKDSNVAQRADVKPLTKGREVEELWERNPINGCSAMFRRDCIEKTGWFDEGLGGRRGYTADGAMWHKMAYFFDVAFMNESLLYYRVHNDNVANNIDTAKHWETYRGYMKTWFREYEENAKLTVDKKPFGSNVATGKGLKISWIGVIDPGGISTMFKKAVERYTPHKMRIITHMESRGFDSDIVLNRTMWGGEKTLSDFSEVRKVAKESDVLLFSAAVAPGVSQFDARYRDSDDVPFGEIDWREYTAKKRCAVFFYGSTAIRRNYQWYLDLYREKGWPIITCQPDIYRNMPGSTYTPILVDLENPRYHRDITVGDQITIIHSPTDRPIKNTDIYESVGRKISSEYPNVSFKLCENMGFEEAINLKRTGSIAFDQLQIGDGYYCLSSVENSALGMVNMVHLDEFGRKCIANSIGTNELPWYTPSTEEEVHEIMKALVSDPKRLEAEQKHTYEWFRKWWHEKDLIFHLTNFLESV